MVQAPPIYVQEKIHPKHLVEDLKRQTRQRRDAQDGAFDLFGDFNGLDPDARTRFYQHDQNWQNRLILGDSLNVMTSLAEREALKGKVQCIYFDPPYGIKFNSNWQVSTRSTTVTDGKLDQITREPEQVKAFRDTWKDGIHSYLTYLRDRLTAMRDLLTESGSIFVQIGDGNVHRVRAVMDEVFGSDNFYLEIVFKKAAGSARKGVSGVTDYILWFAKDIKKIKVHRLFKQKSESGDNAYAHIRMPDLSSRRVTKEERLGRKALPEGSAIYQEQYALAAGLTESCVFDIEHEGKVISPRQGRSWLSHKDGMQRLKLANRLRLSGIGLRYVRFINDFPVNPLNNFWSDTASGSGMGKIYVVQTNVKVIQRCILMTTDPSDLVLDPTCGAGTTASVAEQWGRRWITIDTSRVALALARTRLMSARYPYYYLADSPDGRTKEQAVSGKIHSDLPTCNDIRQGFVYERAPRIMLRYIANNPEIDVIWNKWQETLEPLRRELNHRLGTDWQEWQVPTLPRRTGRLRCKTCTSNTGNPASSASRKSTVPSRKRPSPNCSTTVPTRTSPKSASPDPSPSRACRPIGSSPPRKWRTAPAPPRPRTSPP